MQCRPRFANSVVEKMEIDLGRTELFTLDQTVVPLRDFFMPFLSRNNGKARGTLKREFSAGQCADVNRIDVLPIWRSRRGEGSRT
jgi:hypothetical protein